MGLGYQVTCRHTHFNCLLEANQKKNKTKQNKTKQKQKQTKKNKKQKQKKTTTTIKRHENKQLILALMITYFILRL